jgi:RNA polymerase sigma-70 factor (ECF subfamily)
MEQPAEARSEVPLDAVDGASQQWLRRLGADGAEREDAVGELRVLLLRAARFEIERRRATVPHLRGGDFDDLAQQSANDALLAVLAKLDQFRGESRFTTWAYKFALLEAAVKLRRRAWQEREIPLEEEGWSVLADAGSSAESRAEDTELFDALGAEIGSLTPRQREVLVAVTLNDVPIDVLAERLRTTRGALYKTLHTARAKLREGLAARGLRPDPRKEE